MNETPKTTKTRRALSEIRSSNEGKIFQAASEVFAEKGYAAATTQAIADKAGIPKANLHYYVGTKANLYLSVLNEMLEIMVVSADFLDASRDPVDAFTSYISDKIEISRNHPHASKLFASEVISGGAFLDESFKQKLDKLMEVKSKTIAQWVDEGLMDPVDSKHLMFMIWASTQTYADFNYQVSLVLGKEQLESSDFDDATKLITKIIIKGCGIRSRVT